MSGHPYIRLALYIAEWVAVGTSVVLIVVFALTGSILPSPTMLTGSPDPAVAASDVRPLLLALFLLAMAIDGVLLITSRLPGLFRYPVRVDANNVDVQYHLSKIVLNVVTTATNIYMSGVIVLFYLKRIEANSTTLLSLTALLGAVYALSWLAYYAAARHYR